MRTYIVPLGPSRPRWMFTDRAGRPSSAPLVTSHTKLGEHLVQVVVITEHAHQNGFSARILFSASVTSAANLSSLPYDIGVDGTSYRVGPVAVVFPAGTPAPLP